MLYLLYIFVVVGGRLTNLKFRKYFPSKKPKLEFEFGNNEEEKMQTSASQIQLVSRQDSTSSFETLREALKNPKTKKDYIIEALVPFTLREWNETSKFSRILLIIKVGYLIILNFF